MTDTPSHRAAFAARSGDTHVIGKDGVSRNVDQASREAAASPAKAAKPRVRKARATKSARPAAPIPSGEQGAE